jgi:pimeloyl-ACP methyl ester carboxylesterase
MMKSNTLTTADGVQLNYAHSIGDPRNPWITFVIPFGLDTGMAAPFFEFFESHYNVCTWESRLILESSDRPCVAGEFSIDLHVADMLAVMDALNVREAILVGYCSGAGIALAGINLAPNRFSELILAHGEYTLLAESKCVTQFAADMDSLLSLAASSDERARLVYEKIEAERFDTEVNRPRGLDRPFSDIRFLKRYAKNYLQYKAVAFEELAAEITHATLVMAGGRDVQVNIASSTKIHDRMRNANIFIDPDADHYGVLTKDSPTLIAIWNYICENGHGRLQRRFGSARI